MARRPSKLTDRYEFTVVGTGLLPYDMLRYDCCWPSSSAEARTAAAEVNQIQIMTRPVVLRGTSAPTVERWKSFGWEVRDCWFIKPDNSRQRDF